MRLNRQLVMEQRPLELTPVVNVIMLLVFFFLLSWSFVLQPGVEVRLPITAFPATSPQGRHVVTLKATSESDPTKTAVVKCRVSGRAE